MGSRRSRHKSRGGQRKRSSAPLQDAARLEAAGDLPGAIAALRAAPASHRQRWPVQQSLGRLLIRVGDPRGAVAAFEQAAALRPEAVDTWNDLGAARAELGQWLPARDAFERARTLAPGDVDVHINLGTLAASDDRLDEAALLLRRAIELDPRRSRAHANLGRVLSRQHAHASAREVFDRACQLDPSDAMLTMDAALARVAARAEDEAEAFIEQALRRHPGHAGLLAARTLALAGQGRDAAVRRLQGLHRFVRTGALDVDPGAIASTVRADPTLTDSPRSHATRGGQHSGALDPDRQPVLAGLRDAIVERLRRYIHELPDIDHPLVRARPRRIELLLWSVVLTEGGYQIPHIHPEAWLSGVFYAELPPAVGAGSTEAGCFRIGEIDPALQHRAQFERRTIVPEAGMLVLFPSYLWHRTVPWQGPGHRVSVAFDVVAAAHV